MRLSKVTYGSFKLYVLSVCAFPKNQTHAFGVVNIALYQQSNKNQIHFADVQQTPKIFPEIFYNAYRFQYWASWCIFFL